MRFILKGRYRTEKWKGKENSKLNTEVKLSFEANLGYVVRPDTIPRGGVNKGLMC